jgi:putative adenylate-forming enzyme
MRRSLLTAWTFISAFTRARWGYRFKDRTALLRWQKHRMDAYLRKTLDGIAYYARQPRGQLGELPIVDKAEMLANFSAMNRCMVSLESACSLALQAEVERDFSSTLPLGISVGLSSGTSGSRGVFLVSPRERALWAGTVLGRTLTRWSLLRLLNPLGPRLKIALCLRANSNLYTTVQSFRLQLQFCDLLRPMHEWLELIRIFSPDILIAPSSVLRSLAGAQLEGRLTIRPRQVISVAEVLEQDDAELITGAWALKPSQIYQCTEGLLGQSCPAGSVHLNEEFVHFEQEWLDSKGERFVPLITDFTRTTQIFARHRIEDVLRVNPDPCPCGRVTMRLSAIEGRSDDVLWLPSIHDGLLQPVFPDVLRQSIALSFAGTNILEYRIEQHGNTWQLHAQHDNADARTRIATGINQLCARLGCRTPRLEFRPWSDPKPGAKRRRIACVKRPADTGQLAAVSNIHSLTVDRA